MAVEPTYRIDWKAINALTVDEWFEMATMYQGGYMNEPLEGYIEPDTRLQDIADAWKAHGNGHPDGDILSDLLDALGGTDDLEPVVLDDYERQILDRALDALEGTDE